MTGRRAAALLAALAVLMLVAQTLRTSAERLYPRYDEVSYLALGRAMAHEGGLRAQVGCYLDGRCKEDNRPPLYQLLLAPFLDDTPSDFARAKLVELAMALLLVATVWVVVRRVFSPVVAAGSVVLLCLMPVMPDYGARLMHDLLFCAVTFAAVFAIADWQERGVAHWFVAGGIIGLAFLTKGSGHLLWLPLLVTALVHHRGRLWRRPLVYAAAAGFLATAFFLLMRNVKLWGSPFYNVNSAEVWLDSWRQALVMRLTPERAQIGLGWYLRHHSAVDLVIKLGRGLGAVVGLFVYAAGFGAANIPVRVATGLGVMALAVLGLRRRWRAGRRSELVAVLSTVAFFIAALALAASGAPEPQVRYVLPYVVLLIPFAVHEALERFGRRVDAWRAARFPGLPAGALVPAVVALLLVARLAWAVPGLRDPRGLYAVDPQAHETSVWLSGHLAPGERFALPFQSYYSTWDVPRPELDPRWFIWFGLPANDLLRFMRQLEISKVVIDRADTGLSGYADKLAIAPGDAHGPLALLGWPRCFADSKIPSRFLIYCRP